MGGAVQATGVELRQVEDPAQWLAMFAVNHGRLAAERAARRLEAGELVLVQAYSFIEFVADGQDGRFYGPEFGAREVEAGPDPSKRLIEIAEEQRAPLLDGVRK